MPRLPPSGCGSRKPGESSCREPPFSARTKTRRCHRDPFQASRHPPSSSAAMQPSAAWKLRTDPSVSMHPLFQHWRRFLLYITAWIELGVVLGVIAHSSGRVGRLEGIALLVPMMVLLGFVCLGSWYVCRS